MHDRSIDGKAYTFGNHGALWMNAMTWFDHETESIWTQPWGRALTGELKGVQLQLLPFSLVPWGTWKAEHPETLALKTDGLHRQESITDEFVAGVAIGKDARAYPFPVVAEEELINDLLGDLPLIIYTDPETRMIRIFIRQLSDGTRLTFAREGEVIVDDITKSHWNLEVGLAVEGQLNGQGLREIPYISSYDWAWHDFYPQTDFYIGAGEYFIPGQ